MMWECLGVSAITVTTLRAKLSCAVYCNRSVGLFVCGSVTMITQKCMH